MTQTFQQFAIQSVRESIQRIIELVESLPEEIFRWNPSEQEWSIIQIIAHLNEAIPYWLKEIQKIKRDQSLPWGRGLTDEARLRAVSKENVDRLSISKSLEYLNKIPSQVGETISSLNDDDLLLMAPSKNPKFTGKPIKFIIEHLIVEHIQKHYQQIQRNLAKRNQN
jgi:uncharacterized damage-inducible protein DinB